MSTAAAPPRAKQTSSDLKRLLGGEHLIVAIVAVGCVATALLHGGYSPEFRAGAAIVLWWAVVVGIGLAGLPRAAVPRLALVCGGSLAALAGLTLLSLGWAADDGRAFTEVVRVAGYLGLFALVVVASPRGSGPSWLSGLAIGLVAVTVLALGSRLQPELFPANKLATLLPSTRARLSYPLGYWNGLGAAMALTAVVLAGLAAFAASRLGRALAAAALPLPVLALFLTSSRGAALAGAAGAVVLLVASRERVRVAVAAVVGGAGGAVLILIVLGQSELLDGKTATAAARSQGHRLLLAALVVVALAGVLHYALDGAFDRVRIGRPVKVALGLVAAAVLVAGLVAANPLKHASRLTDPPAAASGGGGYVAHHFTSASGNGRAQFWRSALDAFEAQPLRGIGAGGYEAWWAQHGSISYYVRDAHSLFLESLGELGVIGFCLVALFFVSALAAGLRSRASGPPGAATALALIACGAVSAALDWTWELPAAFAPVVLVAAVVTGPAGATSRLTRLRNGYGAGVATLLLAWAAIIAAGVVFVSEAKLDDSRAEVRAGQTRAAAASADVAARIEPWASAPHLQLALVEERRGAIRAALRASADAIRHASNDWRVWLTEARLRAKAGDVPGARRAFERARRLNPRSPIFTTSP